MVSSLIEINPAICGGKPVITGTRIMVRNILGLVAGGYTPDRILQTYPELTAPQVSAALADAAQIVDKTQAIAP